MALWRANMSSIVATRILNTAANTQSFLVVANVADFDELYAMSYPIRAQMAASNININANTTLQPRFSLLSIHSDLTLTSCTSPGGTEFELYKLVPRSSMPYWSAVNTASSQQNLLSNLIVDSYSLYSTYPSGGVQAASGAVIGQTPYMMSQISSSFKIKTLGRGRLLCGGQRKFKINQYYRGGKEVNLARMATNQAGVNAPHTRMIPSHKPYFLVVRFWGTTGGDAATNPTTIGTTLAGITSQITVKYAYGYGLQSPVNNVYNYTAGTATFASAPIVPVSGAVAQVA